MRRATVPYSTYPIKLDCQRFLMCLPAERTTGKSQERERKLAECHDVIRPRVWDPPCSSCRSCSDSSGRRTPRSFESASPVALDRERPALTLHTVSNTEVGHSVQC